VTSDFVVLLCKKQHNFGILGLPDPRAPCIAGSAGSVVTPLSSGGIDYKLQIATNWSAVTNNLNTKTVINKKHC